MPRWLPSCPSVFFHFWFHTSFTLFSRNEQRNFKSVPPGEQTRLLLISKLDISVDYQQDLQGFRLWNTGSLKCRMKTLYTVLHTPSLSHWLMPPSVLCTVLRVSVSQAAPLLIVCSLYHIFCSCFTCNHSSIYLEEERTQLRRKRGAIWVLGMTHLLHRAILPTLGAGSSGCS